MRILRSQQSYIETASQSSPIRHHQLPATVSGCQGRGKTVDKMIPRLNLKDIFTSDFPIALQSIFGESVKSMGANTVRATQGEMDGGI